VAVCLLSYGQIALFQSHQAAQFDAQRPASISELAVHHGGLVGRLTIPRIGLSAMVIEGDDESILFRAVGHIPGTALPGASGTVGLAGHRDTFFHALRGVRKSDTILFETTRGAYQYRVVATSVVQPTDTKVLRPSIHPSLVLVTCYPFGFVGRAPNRFVVTALSLPREDPALDHVRLNALASEVQRVAR
jgi:LPXTG-site transpeptidase (sortase) family protein